MSRNTVLLMLAVLAVVGVAAETINHDVIGVRSSLPAINEGLDSIRRTLGMSIEQVPVLSKAQHRQLAESGKIKLCAEDFDPDSKRKTHILVNVNAKNKATLQWVAEKDEPFCVYITIEGDECEIAMWGSVVPLDPKEGTDPLKVHAVFSGKINYEQCYCATEHFAGSPPNYKKIEKRCTTKAFCDRPEEFESFYNCPHCAGGLCKKADKKRKKIGTPDPVYANWYFFKMVEGMLSGPGLPRFREEIKKSFPEIDASIDSCTLDINNVPLPQFGCSDLNDPLNGYGYGVNAKNLDCGFATWFNCQEDVEVLAESKTHVADINFNLLPCKKKVCKTSAGVLSPQQCKDMGGFECKFVSEPEFLRI